ncbi:Crp/Fnr family transcriptional regulator [Plastoroseomonas hellenica]
MPGTDDGGRKAGPPIHNALLRKLPGPDRDRLLPLMQHIELPLKAVLFEQDGPLPAVYFIESGTISMIAGLADGAATEVGLVGPEGLAGLPLLLSAPTSPFEAVVQLAGSAWRLPASECQPALLGHAAVAAIMLRYVDSFHFQVAQTAVCNGRHQVEQRLARWLLMTHDRSPGDRFSMTHEFLSKMLGVRRPGVTLALGALTRAGLVQHERGAVHVIDRGGLEAAACECYANVRRRYEWLAS